MCDECAALQAQIDALEQVIVEASTLCLGIDQHSTEAKHLLPVQTPEAAYHQGKADVCRAVCAILRESKSAAAAGWLETAQSPTYPKLGPAGQSAELLLAGIRGVLNRLASHLHPILQRHRQAPDEAVVTVNVPLALARELWQFTQQ